MQCKKPSTKEVENSVIIYSPPCRSKHVWLTFFCETNKQTKKKTTTNLHF